MLAVILLGACNGPGAGVAPLVADADASSDARVGVPVVLDGTGSSGPAGATLSFAWSLVVRPDGSTSPITDADRSIAAFVPDVAGTYGARVTVQAASDQATADVTIVVAQSEPPTASIETPADGAQFGWWEDGAETTGHRVTFTGGGSSVYDGDLAGASLRWSTRRTDAGVEPWVVRDSGASIEVLFPWLGCSIQAYDVRLEAIDAIGMVGVDTISISVVPPPC